MAGETAQQAHGAGLTQEARGRLLARAQAAAERAASIEAMLADGQVLADSARVRALSVERAGLTGVSERYLEYRKIEDEASALRATITMTGGDETEAEYRALAEEELGELKRRSDGLLDEMIAEIVTGEDRAVGAAGSVILEIRAGVGGDEAGLWVGDLAEMYRRFAAAKGWH